MQDWNSINEDYERQAERIKREDSSTTAEYQLKRLHIDSMIQNIRDLVGHFDSGNSMRVQNHIQVECSCEYLEHFTGAYIKSSFLPPGPSSHTGANTKQSRQKNKISFDIISLRIFQPSNATVKQKENDANLWV